MSNNNLNNNKNYECVANWPPCINIYIQCKNKVKILKNNTYKG